MSIEGTAKTEYASLSGKIHTFVVDKTLSISGACADAKATGEAIEEMEDSVTNSVVETIRPYIDDTVDSEVEDTLNSMIMTAEKVREICV